MVPNKARSLSLSARLLSPLSPPADRPRVSSAYITVPDDRPAHVRRKTSHPRAHPSSAACRQRMRAAQTPLSALRAAEAARPTTGRFQSIPRDPHTMEAGTARLRDRMLHLCLGLVRVLTQMSQSQAERGEQKVRRHRGMLYSCRGWGSAGHPNLHPLRLPQRAHPSPSSRSRQTLCAVLRLCIG
jgi:hypothetical protein